MIAEPHQFLPGGRFQPGDRRSDYDVTNTVNVCSVADVRRAVLDLFGATYPGSSFDALWLACHDFELLFEGRLEGFIGCDTVYHDKQHSLDVTLAMARLIAGFEKNSAANERLGPERAILGIITALFHDAGYIRRIGEPRWQNGAEFTLWHISRSARFLREMMPRIGCGEWVETAVRIVHFTGYEINVDDIELDDPRDLLLGHFLGTADLMAQMADRCYLEKCRDRLYAEFVLAGVAVTEEAIRVDDILYESGIDLLKKTPSFYRDMALDRLNSKFNGVYRYIESLYDGRNPYFEFIDKNLRYLEKIIQTGRWHELRRIPHCYTVLEQPMHSVSALVSRKLADLNAPVNAQSESSGIMRALQLPK